MKPPWINQNRLYQKWSAPWWRSMTLISGCAVNVKSRFHLQDWWLCPNPIFAFNVLRRWGDRRGSRANYLFFFSRLACFFSLAVFWGFFLTLFFASLPFDIWFTSGKFTWNQLLSCYQFTICTWKRNNKHALNLSFQSQIPIINQKLIHGRVIVKGKFDDSPV